MSDDIEHNASCDAAQIICAKAQSLGFDDCGIISLDEMDGYRQRLNERMARVPQSKEFYEHISGIANIKERFPWAKSLLICTTWLGRYRFPKALRGKYAKAFLLSPQSAAGCADYKTEFQNWLTDCGIGWAGGDEFGHASVGGLRYAAMAAGLGIIRKNNFFYSEKGSYVELDGYVLDIACYLHREKNIRPCAEACGLCIKSCPTGALCAPYALDPMRCVSFCTTFGHGMVPTGSEESAMGEWIAGCDVCQDRCPHNRKNWDEGEDFPGLEELIPIFAPENIVKASDKELCEKVIPKTAGHIAPNEVQTLRINAERALRYAKAREKS